jgi:hypothetical protein
MSLDDMVKRMSERNASNQASLWVFGGIGVLFLLGVIWAIAGFHVS